MHYSGIILIHNQSIAINISVYSVAENTQMQRPFLSHPGCKGCVILQVLSSVWMYQNTVKTSFKYWLNKFESRRMFNSRTRSTVHCEKTEKSSSLVWIKNVHLKHCSRVGTCIHKRFDMRTLSWQTVQVHSTDRLVYPTGDRYEADRERH